MFTRILLSCTVLSCFSVLHNGHDKKCECVETSEEITASIEAGFYKYKRYLNSG